METLRCVGLRKSFGGILALAGVQLTLPPSGITAIIGPNGAGKTTLLNVLTGFLRPDAGHCFLGDREITRLPSHRIAQLGVVRSFQDLRLIYQVSVLDNLLLAFPNQRGESLLGSFFRVGVAAEEAGIHAAANEILRTVDLEGQKHTIAGELSYGQQKFLALACCIATGARILLLDEPVAGVHPEMVTRILDLLQQLRHEDRQIVFIEHDISAVRRVADHLVVLDDGKVIAQGQPSDVLQRPEIMEAFLG